LKAWREPVRVEQSLFSQKRKSDGFVFGLLVADEAEGHYKEAA
jgi:hypothetical protein